MAAQKRSWRDWQNRPKYDPRHGTRDATAEEKDLAGRALMDLAENQLRVTLVPAPRQSCDGHMVRTVECENPRWYRDFVKEGLIRRSRVIQALTRVSTKGIVRRNGYESQLLPILREREHELISWRAE